MSNFWANKLGGGSTPRPAAPAPVAQQSTNGPWWASPTQPYPQPVAAPETVPEQPQSKPPARAQVARQDTNCPECAGGEYFKPVGHPNAMAQCFTCGYNARFTQSTAGLPSTSSNDGPTTPAKQTASGGAGGRSNYKPGTIIRPDGTV